MIQDKNLWEQYQTVLENREAIIHELIGESDATAVDGKRSDLIHKIQDLLEELNDPNKAVMSIILSYTVAEREPMEAKKDYSSYQTGMIIGQASGVVASLLSCYPTLLMASEDILQQVIPQAQRAVPDSQNVH